MLWAIVGFKENIKILLQPVPKYYTVAAILTNCHTCLYGNNTSAHFDSHPPTIRGYWKWSFVMLLVCANIIFVVIAFYLKRRSLNI